MPTTSLPTRAPVTLVATEAPSTSTSTPPGLELPDNLSHEQWLALGRRLAHDLKSSLWRVGDWLAYGQKFYTNGEKKQIENGLYAKVAGDMDLSEQTLRNAKCVCLKLPMSRRRDKLTFSHAAEIVGRVPEGMYDYWIDRVIREELPVKSLREMLRKTKAVHKDEANDGGTKSFLETARQFTRDFLSECDDWNPSMRREVQVILTPVLKKLAG